MNGGWALGTYLSGCSSAGAQLQPWLLSSSILTRNGRTAQNKRCGVAVYVRKATIKDMRILFQSCKKRQQRCRTNFSTHKHSEHPNLSLSPSCQAPQELCRLLTNGGHLAFTSSARGEEHHQSCNSISNACKPYPRDHCFRQALTAMDMRQSNRPYLQLLSEQLHSMNGTPTKLNFFFAAGAQHRSCPELVLQLWSELQDCLTL